MKQLQCTHRLSSTYSSYVIRMLQENEVDLLKDFLYEAIFVPKGANDDYGKTIMTLLQED